MDFADFANFARGADFAVSDPWWRKDDE